MVGTSPGLGFYRLIRSIGRRLETLSRTDIDQRNPPPGITLPDIVGQNAGGVEDRLRGLGVTSVELSFATPEYKSVWAPSKLDSGQHRPAPGCLVNRYNRVVVYVTK